ncbi:MAG: class I SAM-dependent methyltransferase [Acholeplasmatales bacterium]|nr:class I SAM-dependent methyltransferase [Acholeplasmatales bacterium]
MTRLDYITSLLSEYNSVCDVGTDHGFVPINAIKSYNLSKAYALDINEGPLDNARKNIISEGLSDKIECILSDGLKDFNETVDAIVIAGMGGLLIKSIIETSLDKALKARALILCPNKEEASLRDFLVNNGFYIEHEHILYDKGHYYEIIKVVPGKREYNNLDILYGPFLRKEKSKDFIDKWNKKLYQLESAYKKCSRADKKDDILNKINAIKEILLYGED